MNAEEIKLVINPIMETGDIKTAVNQIQGFFNKMNLSKGMKGDMESIFRELIDEAETFERKSKEAFKTAGDVKSFENSAKKINSLFEKISSTMEKLGGEDLSKLFTIDDSRIVSLTSEITKLEQKISQLSATEIKNVTTAIQEMRNVSKSGSVDKFFSAFNAGDMSAAESALKGLVQNVQAFGGSTADTKVAIDLMMSAFEAGKIDDVKVSFDMLEDSLASSKGKIVDYVSNLKILLNSFTALSGSGDISKAKQDIISLSQEIERINTENINTLGKNFSNALPAIEKVTEEVKRTDGALVNGAKSTQEFNKEISEIKNRATYFLGLENSVDLFKQGVKQAIEVVKELDAAMAETAVVTDFSIGDMWDRLPEYTQMANELGVATQGVYEASTLYYQQGLQTEEVTALTAETLKMARIAGLECADATNLMTAALRGFNMEISETSAQRVNDVYSELAAITAADTNEIATAMTKTASIANNANMELETTAALLAQMIETTREPAETAGTAMKTIIARFTEMKKAASDIVTVEGEEVSVNKVDAALASVGVQLKNTKGEFRDLDDVLLELASKWNSLDIMSQRYIATTAAGSRQQSRFIAMMQDYDRTMQLVDAAYNSAGASNAQFEKTQESLESKINKLKNAWNEFLMGIANSTIIKTGIDLLTGLLNIVNKLTTIPGDNIFSSLASSVLKLATALGALRIAKKGIDYLFPEEVIGSVGLGKEYKQYKEKAKVVREQSKKRQALTAKKRDNKIYEAVGLQDSGKEIALTKQRKQIDLLSKERGQRQAYKEKRTFRLRNDLQEKISLYDKGTEEEKRVLKLDIDEAQAKLAALEAQIDSLDAKSIGIDVKTEEARAKLEQLEAEVKADPLNKELQLQKAEAEAELEYFEALQSDNIEKNVDVRLNAAKVELETWEAKEEADPIFKTIVTRQKPGSGKGLGNKIKIAGQGIKNTTGDAVTTGVNKLKEVPNILKSGLADKISPVVSSMGALLPILAGVVAALGAVAATWAITWYTDPIQQAQREVNKLSAAVDSASKSFEHLQSSIQGLEEGHKTLQQLKEELNSLVPGSEAYNQKLQEINEATSSLLEQHPGLLLEQAEAPYAEINQESYEQTLTSLKQKESIASGAKAMLNADLAVAEKNLSIQEQLDDLEKEVDTNEFLSGLAAVGGGALGLVTGILGGGLVGAGAGAGVGALAGGIGAAPGAVLGAAGGIVVGGVGGAVTGATMAYDAAREAQAEQTQEYEEQEAILQKQLAIQKRSQDVQYKTAIASGLGEDIAEENKQTISNALLTNLENRKTTETEAMWEGLFNLDGANKKEIKEWAERSDYEYRDNKVYDSEGNEISTEDNEAIAEQLAYMRALEKTQADAKIIEQSLGLMDSQISSILSGDLETSFTEEQVKDLVENSGEKGKTKLQEAFEKSISGFKENPEKQKEILAAYLGIDPEQIDENQIEVYMDKVGALLESKALEIIQQQKEQNASLQIDIQTLIGGSLKEKGKFSAQVSNSFGLEGMQQLVDFRTQIEANLGAETAEELTLFAATNTKVKETKEALIELNKIDLSNPINGFKELKALASNSNYILKEMANTLLESPLYSIQSQFKSAYTDLVSNEDAMKDIAEYLEDDKIDAGEINELAKNYDQLSQFMKNTEISASGLAKALTGLEQGTISLEGLTSTVLKAISGLTSIEDSLKISEQIIKKFNDTLADGMQNVDDFSSIGENFQEMIENKEYGNIAVTQTIEFIYGEDSLNNINEDTQKYVEFLEKKQKQIASWNEYGGMGFFKDLANDSDYKLIQYDSSGNISYDIGNMTTDEIIESLAQAKEISEEAARVYWEAYVAHSPDAQAKVEANEKERAIETFISEKQKQASKGLLGNTIKATKDEMQALATSLDKEYTELLKDLQEQIQIIDWDATKKQTAKAMKEYVKDLSGINSDQEMVKAFSVGATTEDKQIIDVQAMKAELTEVFTLTEEEANAVINQLAIDTSSVVGEEVITAFNEAGNPITEWVTASDTSALTGKIDTAMGQTQPLSELLAAQDYSGVANILTQIMDYVANIFKSRLQAKVSEILSNLLAAAMLVGNALAGNVPYSWDEAKADATDLIGGSENENNGNNGNSYTELTFNERMENAGFVLVQGGIYSKESPIQHFSGPKIEEDEYSYEMKTVTSKWEDKNGEHVEVEQEFIYYKNGEVISEEDYKVETGESTPTISYIPPLEEDTKDTKEAEEVEKRNYAAENQDKQLEALDRVRETNDREAELIDKLPEEIQMPLKMMNMAEDMAYEYQEIQINKNKLAALESEQELANAEAIANKMLGEQGSGAPIYYDEMLESYMWDVEAAEKLSKEDREKAHETKDSLDELNSSIQEVKSELDGGKIQKIFHIAGKASTAFSKALKDAEKDTRTLGDEFAEFGKKYGLEKPFRAIGDKFEDLIDETNALDNEFEGLGIVSDDVIDKLAEWGASEDMQNLVKNTLGSGGGTFQSLLGDMTGVGGEMLTGIGDMLNFDMMSMGLDMFNQMKDMASQMIQYVVQFVQTIVNWWINREDWLYNLLSAIEQEVRNFNRQSEVEERFRLYSDEGLNDLVSAWHAMRESLEKQIDLNEQLIESRQAELQFLNLTNLPFSPAFYYDYEEERVIENPWVYDIYVLLLDLGAMIPEIGGIFSSIKQLMEDNKQRMEDAVEEIEDARDEILELEKQQLELRTKYMEDEIELEELVMDTIIEKQQEEIDELSAMNDAITEGNEKLIETLNSNLDRLREQRDNEEKEEELGEKERRLAYLRQDTSGANRAEIMDLQDELDDERRDYTDELIDQKISALEEQNELAAEQRQKQIDLLQAQLDHTEKYGLQWEEAQTLIKNGFDSEGRLRVGTDLYNMLMSKEEFTSMGMGSTRQTQQIMDWNVTSIAAAAFREINDIWDEGFGNFTMSNDVHDQSRLHLWTDREVEYRQLPSWLSFLQPAYNTIQDYLWRTGNNVESFVETGFLSGKNSSSILGKTVVPLIQKIAGDISTLTQKDSLSLAEGAITSVSGAIVDTYDKAFYDQGERVINSVGNIFADTGDAIVKGIRGLSESNSLSTQSAAQSTVDVNMEVHINSEDTERGESIGENIFNAFREGISNLSIFK